MKILSKLEIEITKFDKYKPFPDNVRLSEDKTITNVNRFLEVTCREAIDGNARAQDELKKFENTLLQIKDIS